VPILRRRQEFQMTTTCATGTTPAGKQSGTMGPAQVGGEKTAMRSKKFEAAFRLVLLLTLATGTAGANAPTISTVRIQPRQPVSIIHYTGAVPVAADEDRRISTPAHTWVFDDANDSVTAPRAVGKVQTGVFRTPEGPSEVQPFNLGPLGVPGTGNETGESSGVEGRQLRKRGAGHKMGSLR